MSWLNKLFYLNFLVAFLFLPKVFSQERIEFYKSIRSLGMGNSAVAIANDETSLLLNPAGLGRLRDFYGTIIDPEIESSWSTVTMYRTKQFSQPWSISDAVPAAVASPGDYFHFRAQMFPSFVAKNFGVGLIQKYDLNTKYNSSTSKSELFYRNDLGLVLGFNLRLFDGRIKIGMNGRLINRIEVNDSSFDPTQSLDLTSLATAGLAKEGTGFGMDAGILLAAPWTWIPTIGATLHDIGGTSFSASSGQRLSAATARPNTVSQDLDVGIALFPIHGNRFRSTWTVEYKGLLTAQNEPDKAKLMHAGIEFNLADIFFIRAGYNQRYFTGGLELASEHFQIQLATYGEEIGSSSTTTVEDRRYLAKVAFRF